jgi:hypothetical protein
MQMKLIIKHLKLYVFSTFALSLSLAKAEGLNLSVDQNRRNNNLSLSIERADFKIETESVNGTGLKLDYAHHFEYPFELNTSFFTALNGAQSNVSFSGLGAGIYYDVFGNCCSSVKTAYLGRNKLYSEATYRSNFFQLGLGVDQFYLNGSKSVYSSSGIYLGSQYSFNLFNYNLKVGARYSQLGSNKLKIEASFFSLGITFPL